MDAILCHPSTTLSGLDLEFHGQESFPGSAVMLDNLIAPLMCCVSAACVGGMLSKLLDL